MKFDWKTESHVVLDACALIAYLNDEPGADVVAAILDEAPSVEMSAVNLLEIAYDAIRTSGDPQAGRQLLDVVAQLPIKIHWQIDDQVFHHAALFKASFRISLADAFALALAETLNAVIATSDHHEFDSLPLIRAGLRAQSTGETRLALSHRNPPPVAIRQTPGKFPLPAMTNRQLHAILEEEEIRTGHRVENLDQENP